MACVMRIQSYEQTDLLTPFQVNIPIYLKLMDLLLGGCLFVFVLIIHSLLLFILVMVRTMQGFNFFLQKWNLCTFQPPGTMIVSWPIRHSIPPTSFSDIFHTQTYTHTHTRSFQQMNHSLY